MKYICIGLGLLLVLILVKYRLYRRQIVEICRQLEILEKEKTNKRVQTELYYREIFDLANRINHMADRQEAETLSIRQKEQRLKETLTNLSHDIRTPLTSLKGFFELYDEETDAVQKTYYGRIIRERMDDLSILLEELFTYTKLQNDTYELTLEPQNFTKLVLDCLFSFYEQWQEKGIRPALSVDERPAYVLCNSTAVKRVLTNVLRNALVHGDGNIDICYRITEEHVFFQCKNSCASSPELDPARVFERFYKGDAARQESSSGLGLSIARELTLRMGGSMDAKLENNIFTIEIIFYGPRTNAQSP